MSVFVIAEAGVNHNGSLDLARQLVQAAREAGADAVKFQTFKAETLSTPETPKAAYQLQTTENAESHFEMLKKLELSRDMHFELVKHCKEVGILFMSSVFDVADLHFLVNELDQKLIKIPSGELTNGPLLWESARAGCDLIVSTGMSDLTEIETALATLCHGYIHTTPAANFQEVASSFGNPEAQSILKQKVRVLHCTSEYPAPFEEVNLRAMKTLADRFHLSVGFSDHTQGIAIPIAAVGLGATVIEKHFTLDRSFLGPDHAASLEPRELREMVNGIRQVELALGDGFKRPGKSELKNKSVARRSLVAKVAISKGEVFTLENLTSKRPGSGVSPTEIWGYLGQRSDRNYQPNELIGQTK